MAETLAQQGVAAPSYASARAGQFGARLPQFDTAGATAYASVDDTNIFYLVHKKTVPLRPNILNILRRLRNNSIISLRDQHILRINGEERLVSSLEAPLGSPLFVPDAVHPRPLADSHLRNVVLPQIIESLRALHEFGIAHRALHVGRLFYRDSGNSKIAIGECFSAPAGSSLSVVFETPERSLAQDGLRGEGRPVDDFYALGAVLLTLLTGRELQGGRSDSQLLQAKLTQGSYAALCGGMDVPGSMSILIRGLLTDNVEDRWGIDEINEWLERSPPRVHGSLNPWSLSRPVNFSGRNYTDRRFLARAMAADVGAASNYIRRQDLAHWIPHFLPRISSNPELIALVETGDRRNRSQARVNTLDHLVTRFCAMLDPLGPLRYRGLVFMGDALDALITMSVVRPGGERILPIIANLTQGGFLRILSDIRAESCPDEKCKDMARLNHNVDSLPDDVSLDDESLLRSLYELNPGLVCQSPQMSGYWIDGPGDAIKTLDGLILGEGLDRLIDAHICAYLLAHFREKGGRFKGKKISTQTPDIQSQMILELFGAIQNRYDLGPLHGLAKFFAKRVQAQISKIKSRTRREKAEQRLAKCVAAGDVAHLVSRFNMTRVMAADERDWRRAQQQVKMIDMTLRKLSRPLPPSDPKALYRGAQFSTALATLILAMTVLVKVF